jgi:hypothetical protein
MLVLGPIGMQPVAFKTEEPGTHKVIVSRPKTEDRKKFGLKDVWTGAVVANEVTFPVK